MSENEEFDPSHFNRQNDDLSMGLGSPIFRQSSAEPSCHQTTCALAQLPASRTERSPGSTGARHENPEGRQLEAHGLTDVRGIG